MRFLKSFSICFSLLVTTIGGIFFVQCSTPSGNPSSYSQKKYHSFSIRYNTLFNIDAALRKERERLLFQQQNMWQIQLLEKPDYRSNSNFLDSLQQSILELLPYMHDDRQKKALYVRLAQSYFYKEDYYAAQAYLDLPGLSFTDFEVLYYWLRIHNLLGQYQKVNSLFPEIELGLFSPRERSLLYAAHAETFYLQRQIDSAIVYLELAQTEYAPKGYRWSWTYSLALMYAEKENYEQALPYFQAVRRSLTAPDGIKIASEVACLRLQSKDLNQRLAQYKQILKKGYSLGKEGLVYMAVAEDYAPHQPDSAIVYYTKAAQHYPSPRMASKACWKLVQLYLSKSQYDLAKTYLEKIRESGYHDGLEDEARILSANGDEWISLLRQYKEDRTIGRGVAYADFLEKIGLRKEAVGVLKELMQQDTVRKTDYLHRINLLENML